MTDDEIEAAALSDPDAQPLSDEELAQFYQPGRSRFIRDRLGLSQGEFAKRFHIDVRAVEAWEAGDRAPTEIERAYLRVIERNPEAVLAALED